MLPFCTLATQPKLEGARGSRMTGKKTGDLACDRHATGLSGAHVTTLSCALTAHRKSIALFACQGRVPASADRPAAWSTVWDVSCL